MEQRPLRLGDILDDYCPRERRVTNHAIVAMIEEDVRQTRCTTCDTEHAYKGAKVPRRRKKETPGALYKEVLAGMPDIEAAPVLAPPIERHVPDDLPVALAGDLVADADADEPVAAEEPDAPLADDEAGPIEEGPVHRPLIRATLPRIEGHKEVRQAPDFTMRQPLGRGRFRGGDVRGRGRGGFGAGNGHGNGSGSGNGNGFRSGGGSRSGGFRNGNQAPRPGGGRKRSR